MLCHWLNGSLFKGMYCFHSWGSSGPRRIPDLWQQRWCVPMRHQVPLTQWCGITSQKTRIVNYTYEKLRTQRAGIFLYSNCMKQSPAWEADTCAVSRTEATGSSPMYDGDVLVKAFSFMRANIFPFNPSSVYTNQPKVLIASEYLWQSYRRQYLCEQNDKTTGEKWMDVCWSRKHVRLCEVATVLLLEITGTLSARV